MAKKIRFPLNMNGTDVRTIEELREHFDLESVLGYFANGKLVTWLKDRYYDNEANAVEALSSGDEKLGKKLCEILKVPYTENTEEVNIDIIKRRNEKLALLRQLTDDKEIIDNVDCVAFNQDDLSDIFNKDVKKIYLCQGNFEISLDVKNIKYIGIGEPTVTLHKTDNILFDDIFDEKFIDIILIGDLAEIWFNRGLCYEKGYGVEKDYKKAVKFYTKSAEQGYAMAQCNLGWCYENGKGVEQDYKKAVEWYTRAAEQGYDKAQNNLGDCYNYGKGVEKDCKKAVEWYTKAAEQGNVMAQNNLGERYYYGIGVKQDYKKAVEWYTRVSEQGYDKAQNSLGDCYKYGKGVEKDCKKAVEWYIKAAEQGCASAQQKLGSCYSNGDGVEQDYKKAAEWYTRAAEQGDAMVQKNLGERYYYGIGIEKNYHKAVEWYQKSARQGNKTAQKELKKLGETW